MTPPAGPREFWLSEQVQLGYDMTVAQNWGRLSAAQRRGRPIQANDTWIAASGGLR